MFHSWKNAVHCARSIPVCLLLLTLGLTCPESAAAKQSDPVQEGMARHLASEGLPGAVWSLVTPGAIMTGAAGLKHAAKAEAMRIDTRVHVGSVAKTVLAMGVLRLVTTGKLTLDTEVASLLPALRFDNPWQSTDPVRIRHLLAHTADLDNFRFSQIFSLRARADTPLLEALGDKTLSVNTRPGARYAYSSTGYHLLGMVIEAVTHQRYERYLDTELLGLLGMHDSSFEFSVQTGASADPRLAMGHFEHGVAQPAVPVYFRPATQFMTTAADMGRFARFLMSDGRAGDTPLIAPALMAALGNAEGTEAARAGLAGGHGLGLARRDRHQVLGDCHPGTMPGFQAMLCLYPREGKAFFVAANADVETADYDKLNKVLIDALDLAASPAPTPSSSAPANMDEWGGVYVPAWHAVASLAWVDSILNAVDVRWDGAQLQLAPLQGKPASLRPAGGMLFQAGGRIAPSHVLYRAEGERMLSDGLRTYRKEPFAKMLCLWLSAALGLAGLLTVLLRGVWLLARGRLRSDSTLAMPLAALLLLFAPLPFFFTQSFLQLGDFTIASGLLAFATCALPPAMAYALVRLLLRTGRVRRPALDAAALCAVTQWMVVLAAWGLLPVVLWE